jgi:hypothetical protein
MSKRHQANRRRTYGRRQHEVRERQDRGQHGDAFDFDLGEWGATPSVDPLAFLDPRAPRIRFALGD